MIAVNDAIAKSNDTA